MKSKGEKFNKENGMGSGYPRTRPVKENPATKIPTQKRKKKKKKKRKEAKVKGKKGKKKRKKDREEKKNKKEERE